jgi:phytoene dehydrogenase-like protein
MLYRRNEIVTSSFDVIVVGSGLAGLTAANKLAMEDQKVLLLEAHNKLGGFATWFYRAKKEYIFDVSLHGFPVGMKKTCRKYWNKEIADLIVPLKDVRFDNPQFKIQTDFTREDYSKIMVEKFGLSAETVEAFFTYVRKMNFYDDQSMTNRDLFEKFFPGRNDVVRFLMEPIVYANGSSLDDPAITYGIVFSNFMSKGVYTFKGGTDQLIKKMQAQLLENGVHIKKQCAVETILFQRDQNGKAHVKGVRCQDGQEIHAPVVLSNANIVSTIQGMIEPEFRPNLLDEQSNKVRLNTSSCQVYMALKKGSTIEPMGDLLFTSTAKTFETESLLAKKVTSRTFSVYYPECRPHLEQPLYTIVSSTNALYDDWAQLNADEYAREKELLIEDTIKSLEHYIPDIREKLDHIEAATPVTVEKFTRHPKGTSFGTKFEGLDVSMNLHQHCPGLFHAGSVGIIMSGWLGAANYGVIQAFEILRYLDEREKRHQTLIHTQTEATGPEAQEAHHV